MIKKQTHLFFLLFFIVSILTNEIQAQTYGNEWIKYSQKYLKIKISQEGLYGINVSQVIESGLVTQNIDPKKFQLFNKGQQIPLLVTGDNDNNFNGNDKIVFYGEPNAGDLDKILYTKEQDIPNEAISLYEDENYYFLTYNESTNGLRLQNYAENPSGIIPEPFIVYKSRLNFSSNYYAGEFILSGMSLSEYIEGEGYLGAMFGKGENVSFPVNTPDFINTPDFQSAFSFYVAGRSNALSTNANGNNHHLKILVNGATLHDTLYSGYKTIRKKIPFSINNNVSTVIFSSKDDIGAVTDFQAPGYAQIIYSRKPNLNAATEMKFNLENGKNISHLNFKNSALVIPIIIDIDDNYFFNGIKSGSEVDFVVNNNKKSKTYFLADLNSLKPATLEKTTFRHFIPINIKPFLLIANKALSEGTNAYKTYNGSRNIETTIAYTDDLYNEFYYGFHHPQALKNFFSWSMAKGISKPEYLLLLGKGMELAKNNLNADLVPTLGYPASDNMLTSGLNGVPEQRLATGRVPAKTNQEIENYLNKLKIYNQLPNEIWRKKLVHISGGKSLPENLSFSNYQNTLYNKAKGEFFGASVVNVKKNVSDPVTENLTDKIVEETRKGTALVSFLGHGSTTTTEIILGEITSLNNQDKPTTYLVNGCSTGNVFTSVRSLGEQFLLQKDFGAVAWIGTTSEGVASYLNALSAIFYNNWFKNFYGNPISKGIKEGIKTYQNSSDKLNLAHSRQYIFLGDPYIKFFSSEQADYAVDNSSISLVNPNQNASLPTLKFRLVIKNLGKAISDSVSVKITRTLPNNTLMELPILKVKPIFNTDTFDLNFNNTDILSAGNNKITALINSDNLIAESNKNNNQAILDFFLPGNGINLIYPLKNSIVAKQGIALKAQPDNLFTKDAEYLFEIDTLNNFSSSFKLSSGVVKSGLLPEWKPNISFENNKIYYWRGRLNLPEDKGGNWSMSSFTFIENDKGGFAQSHKGQLQNVSLFNIIDKNNNGDFEFVPDIFSTNIQTRGDDASLENERRFRYQGLGLGYNNPEFQGITIISYSPTIFGKRFSYPSPYNFINNVGPIIGYTGQYYWNTNIATETDSLLNYLKQIPEGYHVIGHNGMNAAFNELPDAVKTELSKVGLSSFNLVNRGEPYMFWGKKGSLPGSATEVTADYSAPNPRGQLIRKFVDLNYAFDEGFIVTEKIGPANQWESALMQFRERSSDIFKYEVIGIDAQQKETVLISQSQNKINLENINPLTYPFIKIKSHIKNAQLRTVPLVKTWKVNYTPVSELTFNPEYKHEFHANPILQGDSLKWELGISNLSKLKSDSVFISYKIKTVNNATVNKTLKPIAGLEPESSTSVIIKESTIDYVGENNIQPQIKYKASTDNFLFNNSISLPFKVEKDSKEPIVNIVFDGRPIINGEIVSPKPIIDITAIDENKFLLLNDTSLVDIYLKNDQDIDFRKIAYSGSQLSFSGATNASSNRANIQFKPTKLDDGIYTLKVRSKDVSGNFNANNDYQIDFEVINQSAITHFYPYPNPVVNSMKFVFTLTGDKIPEKIRILILTASGKVVREILKPELGNIKIGNNESDFTWNGTDQFGDRLANGVYFYKVFIENTDGEIKSRATAGDRFFKNNTGKIYLMR